MNESLLMMLMCCTIVFVCVKCFAWNLFAYNYNFPGEQMHTQKRFAV